MGEALGWAGLGEPSLSRWEPGAQVKAQLWGQCPQTGGSGGPSCKVPRRKGRAGKQRCWVLLRVLHPHRAICSWGAQFQLLPSECREGPPPGRWEQEAGTGLAHPEDLPADVGYTVLLQGIPFRVLHQVRYRASTTELHHQLWSQGGTRGKSICQARRPSPAGPLGEDWSPWVRTT